MGPGAWLGGKRGASALRCPGEDVLARGLKIRKRRVIEEDDAERRFAPVFSGQRPGWFDGEGERELEAVELDAVLECLQKRSSGPRP